MVTLNVHEATYAGLEKRAAAQGLSVEEWLARIARELVVEPAEGVNIEERLARLERLRSLGGNYGANVDYSRDAIYD